MMVCHYNGIQYIQRSDVVLHMKCVLLGPSWSAVSRVAIRLHCHFPLKKPLCCVVVQSYSIVLRLAANQLDAQSYTYLPVNTIGNSLRNVSVAYYCPLYSCYLLCVVFLVPSLFFRLLLPFVLLSSLYHLYKTVEYCLY
jgi:hypothetical protein